MQIALSPTATPGLGGKVSAASGFAVKKRLLIVDDSAFMRVAIRKMVERAPDLEVVGEARNGVIGVEMVRSLQPDVVTMDVEMPEMDGISATRTIMAERPTPVIMVSSITQPNADATVRALREGAVDFVSKSSSFVDLDIINVERELLDKIRFWASHPLARPKTAAAKAPAAPAPPKVATAADGTRPVDLVVIAVSTGGPRTLPDLLRHMGRLRCPVVVAQHMPEVFTASFAKQLAQDTGLDVVEAGDGGPLIPGQIAVLRGGTDSAVRKGLNGGLRLDIDFQAAATVHPSADLLFATAARAASHPVGVILTGMGDDGTRGGGELFRRSHPILVQTPDSCVVGGMPGAAIQAGITSDILPLDSLGRRLRQWAGA